jgi:hypothetical protein
MKNGFYDDIRQYYIEFALHRQSTPVSAVARTSAVTAGVARSLVPFPLYR